MRSFLFVLAMLPGFAHADDWLPQGGIGVRFGSFPVDGIGTGTAIPFHLDGGMRHGRLFFYAEYDHLSLALDQPSVPPTVARGTTSAASASGVVHRGALDARWAFGRAGDRDVGDEMWLEAGLGVQHFIWDAGGVWTRPDLSLAVGTTFFVDDSPRERGGLTLALRVTLAQRNDVSDASPATCGGPCDMATRPTGWDSSVMFDMTLLFGR